jgi:WD40 repeat protein
VNEGNTADVNEGNAADGWKEAGPPESSEHLEPPATAGPSRHRTGGVDAGLVGKGDPWTSDGGKGPRLAPLLRPVLADANSAHSAATSSGGGAAATDGAGGGSSSPIGRTSAGQPYTTPTATASPPSPAPPLQAAAVYDPDDAFSVPPPAVYEETPFRSLNVDEEMRFDGYQLSCIDLELGMIPMAVAVRYGPKAKRLDLSSNLIKDLSHLSKFSCLEELVLDNNLLQNVGFELPPMPHLTTLSINKNKIANLDRLLDEVARNCPAIRFLSMVSNPACPNELVWGKDEEDYMQYRYEVIARLPSLKFLDSQAVRQWERAAYRDSKGFFTRWSSAQSKADAAGGAGAVQHVDHSVATLKFFKDASSAKGAGRRFLWKTKKTVLSLAPLSDKWIVTAGTDSSIKVYDLTSGKWENKCVAILKGHTRAVRAVACFADVRVVSCSDDKTIRIWDLGQQRCIRTLKGHRGAVNSVVALADKRLVSGSSDGTVRVWSSTSKRCTAVLQGHHGAVLCVVNFGSRHVASGSTDESIKVWDLSGKCCKNTLIGHTGHVLALATLHDERLVSGSSDHTIKIWHPLGKKDTPVYRTQDPTEGDACGFVATLVGHTGAVLSVATLAGNKILSASEDRTVAVWDLATLACTSVFAGHGDAVHCAMPLLDGRLASGSDCIKLWRQALPGAEAQSKYLTQGFNSRGLHAGQLGGGKPVAHSLWTATRAGLYAYTASILGFKAKGDDAGSAAADRAGGNGIPEEEVVRETELEVPCAYAVLTARFPSTVSLFASATSAPGKVTVREVIAAAAGSPPPPNGEQSKARQLVNVLFADESDGAKPSDRVLWNRVKDWRRQRKKAKKKGSGVLGWLGIFRARQGQQVVARLDELCHEIGMERITYLAVKSTLVEEFGEDIFEKMKEQVSVELAMREIELKGSGARRRRGVRKTDADPTVAPSPSRSYFPETKAMPGSGSPTVRRTGVGGTGPNAGNSRVGAAGDFSSVSDSDYEGHQRGRGRSWGSNGGNSDLDLDRSYSSVPLDTSVDSSLEDYLTEYFQEVGAESDADPELAELLQMRMAELESGSVVPKVVASEPSELWKVALSNASLQPDQPKKKRSPVPAPAPVRPEVLSESAAQAVTMVFKNEIDV